MGKVWKWTMKTVKAQFRKTGHRPWPLVEEMLITFDPQPRILRSLYIRNQHEKSKNAAWAKKLISSPMSTVLMKHLPQKYSKQGSFAEVWKFSKTNTLKILRSKHNTYPLLDLNINKNHKNKQSILPLKRKPSRVVIRNNQASAKLSWVVWSIQPEISFLAQNNSKKIKCICFKQKQEKITRLTPPNLA